MESVFLRQLFMADDNDFDFQPDENGSDSAEHEEDEDTVSARELDNIHARISHDNVASNFAKIANNHWNISNFSNHVPSTNNTYIETYYQTSPPRYSTTYSSN